MKPFVHRAAGVLAIIALQSVLAAPVNAGTAQDVFASGSCDGSGEVTFQWSVATAGDPDRPEWTGFDVYRVRAWSCANVTRVTEEPIPRPAEGDYTLSITDSPPLLSRLYRYEVVAVDDDRNEVPAVWSFGNTQYWISCPAGSTPITVGRISDLGWTLYITPCEGTCYPVAYLTEPWPKELNAYDGTETVVSFWGDLSCGSLDGCALTVESYREGPCSVTVPIERTSWGGLKLSYR